MVLKALDTRHDRLVALKVRRVPADPREAERAMGEVRTLLGLAPHPGLPVARDDFFEGDEHMLVLDWIDGIDLGRVLATDGAPGLPLSSVLRWAAQASEALTHLHRHDPPIVHGDVKPANLVLDRHGRVVCVDFGVSSTPGRAQRGGTFGYRAPEVAAGAVPTTAADVYGLAATVFALLTGSPPAGVLPPWDGVEPQRAAVLEAALRRGLATEPARRPATVGELVEGLRAGEPDTVPTGTVTVLATEVVRVDALWEGRPLDTPGALARHDLIVDQVVESNGGRRLDGSQDGATVSVFIRADDAARAAVELNRRLVGASDPPLLVRAGLHTGELDAPSGRGPVVVRAGRIRAVAGPGQVILSGTTAALVAAARVEGTGLVALGAHHLDGDGDGDVDAPGAVVELVALSAAGLDVPPDPSVPPYPGLVAFSMEDADVYVGREEEVAALRRLVEPGRVVAVLGPSGSGKSSLLRAGLLPHVPDATVCTPGADPARSLDAAGDGLLVIDQLEELVTASDDLDAQQRFVERLCGHEAGAVVGLRADAYAALARFPGLAAAIAAHHLLLAPMSRAQLRAAIEDPATRRGLSLEAGLADLVLADAGNEPGALPLVAHAMRETWRRRDGRLLTVAGYREAGGVQRAIAATAEAVFAALDPGEREQMRAVLLRMVHPGDGTADSRRRVGLDELRELGDEVSTEALIDRLAAARLVTVDRDSVEPAHEALLRAWPRLAGWIAEERDDLRRHRHLTAAAGSWASGGHDGAELYRGGRLEGALELAERASLTATERVFVEASVQAQADEARLAAAASRRLRRLLVGVGAALVVALVAAAVAVLQLGRASEQRDRADAAGVEADTARLAAESRAAATTGPDLAMLLAVEANRRQDTVQTRSALLGALSAQPQLLAKLHGVDSGLESVDWSPDGAVLATPTSDSTGVFLWDGGTFAPRGEPLATGEEFQLDFDAAFTPDGATLAVVGLSEERGPAGVEAVKPALQVWDVASRSLRATVPLRLAAESVSVVDATHAVVAGPPFDANGPKPEAATQVVDLETGVAGAVHVVGREPVAAVLVGDTVLTLTADGVATLAEAVTGGGDLAATADLSTLVDLTAGVTVVGYDSAGGHVAIGDESGAVVLARITGTASGGGRVVDVHRIDTGGDPPSALAFTADGRRVAVGGALGSTRLFDTVSATPVGTMLTGLSSEVSDVGFSPDGSRLAVAGVDGTGSVWSLDGSRAIGRPLLGHTNAVVATLPVEGGRTLLTASYDGSVVARDANGGDIDTGDVDGGDIGWRVDTGEPVWSAVVDPTGTRVAVGGVGGQVEVLDVRDGSVTAGPVRFDHPVEALAWSPTDNLLVVGADRSNRLVHRLVFLDATHLRPVGDEVTTSGGTVVGLAFSPDGGRLAAVLDNNLVRIVDVGPRSLERNELESVDVPYFSVAWSPDGRRLATGATDGTVQLWNAETLRRAAPAGRQSPYPVRGLAFSPGGGLLASTTELATTQLWDVRTGSPVGGDLVGGDVPVTVAAIPHPARPEVPFVPSFRPDGRVLYVGSDAPMVWSLDTAVWRSAACAVAGRELTDAEWAAFLPGRSTRSTCPR
jgi:WD40 repeat protein/energy-coupling factor transporter ATP-binding protein EcfA2